MTDAPLISVDLEKLLAGTQLPALPQSAIQLLELSQDSSNGPAEFTVPIESDPGLAGQVLRFVNSSYFGFAREISSVKMAITLVGVRTIKNFALWSAVFSLMPNPQCGPLNLKQLWQDSLRRALFARALASQLGAKEADDPFSAALLQDMAIPLLAKEKSDIYLKLLTARKGGQFRLSDLERSVFGWTHAEAAAIMARQWNLPEEFGVLIENHLKLDELLEQSEPDLGILAVAMSALLPTAADPEWVDGPRFDSAYQKLVPSGTPTLTDLLERVDQEFAEFAPILKLSTKGKTLVDFYSEITATPSG